MKRYVKRTRRAPRRPLRRPRRSRMSKSIAKRVNTRMQTYFFTRKCNLAAINPTAGLFTRVNYTFTLADLPNNGEFTSLFDQYKISAVKLTFYPRVTSSDINPWSTAIGIPRIWQVIDYDDSTALVDENVAMQYQNCKIRMANKPFSIYLRPKVLGDVYRTLVTTGYSPKRNTWIDVAQPDVPHYGVKLLMEPVAADGQFQFNVIAKYYLQMKNVR